MLRSVHVAWSTAGVHQGAFVPSIADNWLGLRSTLPFFFRNIMKTYPKYRPPPPHATPPSWGGWVGYLGYCVQNMLKKTPYVLKKYQTSATVSFPENSQIMFFRFPGCPKGCKMAVNTDTNAMVPSNTIRKVDTSCGQVLFRCREVRRTHSSPHELSTSRLLNVCCYNLDLIQ